jgi:hypothetical protein
MNPFFLETVAPYLFHLISRILSTTTSQTMPTNDETANQQNISIENAKKEAFKSQKLHPPKSAVPIGNPHEKPSEKK